MDTMISRQGIIGEILLRTNVKDVMELEKRIRETDVVNTKSYLQGILWAIWTIEGYEE